MQRAYFPINEKITFKFNQSFRKLTKNKKKKKITLSVKGRNLIIHEFYDGIAKFKFEFLCDNTLGAEDYIEISNNWKFVVVENIPNFNNDSGKELIKANIEKFTSLMLIFGQLKVLQVILKRFKISDNKIEQLEDYYFN